MVLVLFYILVLCEYLDLAESRPRDNLRLKIKRNDWLLADVWLLADTCQQAANHCALF